MEGTPPDPPELQHALQQDNHPTDILIKVMCAKAKNKQNYIYDNHNQTTKEPREGQDEA